MLSKMEWVVKEYLQTAGYIGWYMVKKGDTPLKERVTMEF
jgi:hypothetical protein